MDQEKSLFQNERKNGMVGFTGGVVAAKIILHRYTGYFREGE